MQTSEYISITKGSFLQNRQEADTNSTDALPKFFFHWAKTLTLKLKALLLQYFSERLENKPYIPSETSQKIHATCIYLQNSYFNNLNITFW